LKFVGCNLVTVIAWINAYRADPDAAVMIARQFRTGTIALEQALMAWRAITDPIEQADY
jgi:hypothetical protein